MTPFNEGRAAPAAITDLELSYKTFEVVELSAGANNLFGKRPDIRPLLPGSKPSAKSAGALLDGSNVLNAPWGFSPYGINGGYDYGGVSVTF